MRRVARLAAFFILLITMSPVAPAGVAAAQEQPGYWLAGLDVGYQGGPTGTSPETYATPPGGWTVGWWVAGGVFATPVLSLEGELAGTGMMRASEPSRYGYTYNVERKDYFLLANARFHFGPVRGLHLEPVGGAGVAIRKAWTQEDYQPQGGVPTPPVEHHARYQNPTMYTVVISGGIDVRLGGPRFAFVPSFRVRWYPTTYYDTWLPGGSSNWTFSGGAAFRVDF